MASYMDHQLKILQDAMKKVPATKWGFGVLGLLAVIAIASLWFSSPIYAIVGFLLLFIAMVLLYVFSQLVKIRGDAIRIPALMFIYTVSGLLVATFFLLFTSLFFNYPLPIQPLLLKDQVEQRAAAAGLNYVAELTQGLSTPALTKLVSMNTAHHLVGHFDSASNMYYLPSPSIPAEVQELDQKGLIQWSMPRSDFEKVAAKYDLVTPTSGASKQQISLDEVSANDRQILRQFSYYLNSKGLTVYQVIIDTVIDQLKADSGK